MKRKRVFCIVQRSRCPITGPNLFMEPINFMGATRDNKKPPVLATFSLMVRDSLANFYRQSEGQF